MDLMAADALFPWHGSCLLRGMKISQGILSLGFLSLAAIMTACGSSQQQSGTIGYSANGMYIPGGVQGYSSGQVVIGGTQTVNVAQSGNTLQATGYVNAGDRINVNLTNLTYRVSSATCGTKWYNTITIQNPPAGMTPKALKNVTVSLNGQVITGSVVAPTAGMVTLTATLDPNDFHIRCTDIYNNQVAAPQTYLVDLSYAVTK